LIQFTLFYLMCFTIFSYCEYELCLLIYTPVYVVSAYLISLAERDQMIAQQALSTVDSQPNIVRALSIVSYLLIAKYFEK
jgi:hypothetical protein